MQRYFSVFCAAISIVVFYFSTASAEQPDGATQPIGVSSLDFNTDARYQEILGFYEISAPGSKYIRIQFSEIEREYDGGYNIVLLDRNREVLAAYQKSEFSRTSTFVTEKIYASHVSVRIVGEPGASPPEFTLDSMAFQRKVGETLAIVDPPRFMDIVVTKPNSINWEESPKLISNISLRSRMWDASRAVAHLNYLKNGAPYVCTGFLISENLLVTNEHCVNDDAICASTKIIFDYYKDENGNILNGDQYDCKQVHKVDGKLAVSYSLDFAILEVDGAPGNKYGYLEFSENPVGPAQELFIIQHPSGEPKQISYEDCIVKDVAIFGRDASASDFSHRCDTKGGSSGSPVLDEDLNVVGLHHLGFYKGTKMEDRNRAVHSWLILQAIK